MRILLCALVAVCAAVAAAAPVEEPLRVATLTTVLTEVAREVGGSEVRVAGLVGAGTDPHTFNPSPADVREVVDADIVLASGLHLEAYLGRLIGNAGDRSRVFSVGEKLPFVLSTGEGGSSEPDPHWWHSIGEMMAAVDLVRDAFTRLRPGAAPVFARNAAAYRKRLEDLRTWAVAAVSALPPARRQLVTSHDAFGYLARDYGFRVYSINQLSTDSEVDAAHLASLVDRVRRDRIRAVFAESSANPRLVANLMEETGAVLGGTLYADGLGPPGSGAEDYVSMYRHNLRAIVDGLAGP